jgi:hypothetical protein
MVLFFTCFGTEDSKSYKNRHWGPCHKRLGPPNCQRPVSGHESGSSSVNTGPKFLSACWRGHFPAFRRLSRQGFYAEKDNNSVDSDVVAKESLSGHLIVDFSRLGAFRDDLDFFENN